MFSPEALQKAMAETVLVVNFQGGFDTFTFRKAFESDFDLSKEEQGKILDYLKTKIQKGNHIYHIVKNQIDNQEFLSTDYYANPYPRKFLGAYAPVIYKTLGGVMAMSLLRQP